MRLVQKLASPEFAREAISILVLIVSLFTLLSLATYDPADLGANSYPANAVISNNAGILGAHIAAALFGLFGLSAYLLVGLVLLWSTIYFLRKDVQDLGVKLLGVTLLVVAASILFSLRTDPARFGWSDRTPSYGGLLGDAAAAWLRLRFGGTGVYLLVLAIMAVSFLLATDLFFYALLKGWISRMCAWIPTLFPKRARVSLAAEAPAVSGIGIGGSGVILKVPTWLQRKQDLTDGRALTGPVPVAASGPRAMPLLNDLGRPIEHLRSAFAPRTLHASPAAAPPPTSGAAPLARSPGAPPTTAPAARGVADPSAQLRLVAEERARLAGELAQAAEATKAACQAVALERTKREEVERQLAEARAGRQRTPAEKQAKARTRQQAEAAKPAAAKPAAPTPAAPTPAAAKPAAPKPAAPAPAPARPATVRISGSSSAPARRRLSPNVGTVADVNLPPASLLDEPVIVDMRGTDNALREKAATLIDTLKTFKIECELANIDRGPVITMFELALAPGIKVSRVAGLADNIAMALKAPSVRIVAPIPGKSTVGVEVPNLERVPVRLREIAEHEAFTKNRQGIPVMLGKEATGNPLIADLTKMPHLLIAGQTGAGKSVCINSLLLSILLSRTPAQVRLLLVDPKQVELGFYADIPHLLLPVVTDMKAAARILDWAVQEMEDRYELLSKVGARSLTAFNKLGVPDIRKLLEARGEQPEYIQRWAREMPYIVIVIDELADLMMVAAREVEGQITRLAQKSRAIGIHLILATQRPSVDVITGLIKANVPCRISFQVACKIDSRTILDGPGAEKLLGRGDLLFRAPGSSFLHRAQGAYVDDAEVQRVVEHLVLQGAAPEFDADLSAFAEGPGQSSGGSGGGGDPAERDTLYREAVRIILENQRGSVSLLQRKLQIGYTRAAKLIDFMEEDGIVGEPNGSKAREIMMTLEEWEAKTQGTAVVTAQAGRYDDDDDLEDDDDDDDDDDTDEDEDEEEEEDDYDDDDDFDDDDADDDDDDDLDDDDD